MHILSNLSLAVALVCALSLAAQALPYTTLPLAEARKHQYGSAFSRQLQAYHPSLSALHQPHLTDTSAKQTRWVRSLKRWRRTPLFSNVESNSLPPIALPIQKDIEERIRLRNETIHFRPEGPLLGTISNCIADMAYSFDDGPYIWHDNMTDIFAQHQAKFTSFVNGRNFGCIYDESNVASLQRSFREGHLIGSHTWSHAHMNSLTRVQLDDEIERLEVALWKILGIVPALIRPPYGECNEECVHYLNQRHGLTVVTWDVDSGDSVGATPDQCQQKLQGLSHPGPHMPLNHETYQHSATDIPSRLLPVFKQRGYEMQTVDRCLGVAPYKIVGLPQARDSTWTCA